jgi:hypothetical protein
VKPGVALISGTVLTYDQDSYGETVVPGAVQLTLKRFDTLPLLAGHVDDRIVGTVTHLEEDILVGLRYRARLLTGELNPVGNDVVLLLLDRHTSWQGRTVKDGSNITTIDLNEVSVVEHPANRHTVTRLDAWRSFDSDLAYKRAYRRWAKELIAHREALHLLQRTGRP